MLITFTDGSQTERFGVTSWYIENGWLIITSDRSTLTVRLSTIYAVRP